VASAVLKILPKVGGNDAKQAVEVQIKLLFTNTYPNLPPSFELFAAKGLDDDQMTELREQFEEHLKLHYNEEAEPGAVLFNLYEDMSESITKYNDTLDGRC